MAYQGEAFSPGHITAFFVGHDDPDPMRKGSTGAGVCTAMGVHTTVRVREARGPSIEVSLNDAIDTAPTTRAAVRRVLGHAAYGVQVLSRVQLPVSQGFGMSGAGALSTALALDDALGLGRSGEELVAAAHAADVESLTGLGDVTPQSLGGIDLREAPGAPPRGVVRRFPAVGELLLAAVGPPRAKAPILTNPAVMDRIAAAGAGCIDEFRTTPTLADLFRLGRRFTGETGLAPPRVAECMAAVSAYGKASMSMLGNSVFAMGGDLVATILRSYGIVYRTEIDNEGARVV